MKRKNPILSEQPQKFCVMCYNGETGVDEEKSIKGYEFKFYGAQFFIHRPFFETVTKLKQSDHGWVVSEKITGRKISRKGIVYKTKHEAFIDTINYLKNNIGEEKLMSAIKRETSGRKEIKSKNKNDLKKPLRIKSISVSKLKPHQKNARIHNEKNLVSIMRSLEAFGQRTPIVVWKNNFVIKGCGTLEAAKRLGWETIQTVDASFLSEDNALIYAVADNKSSDISRFDLDKLSSQFADFEKKNLDLSASGFKTFEIKPLIERSSLPVNDKTKNDSIKEKKIVLVIKISGENVKEFEKSFKAYCERFDKKLTHEKFIMNLCRKYLN